MSDYLRLFCSVIVILFTTGSANGQSELRERARKYYSLKNKAELAILNEQYDTALAAYKAAFAFKFPNERDIYNAFHIAYTLRDSMAAKEYLDIIFLHGQQKEKYESTPFGRLISTDDFYKWCSRNYDSLHIVAQNSNMPLLAAILDSIFIRDQAIRKQSKEGVYESNSVDLRSADSLNLAEMEDFIKCYGFPNYQLVGVFERCKGGFPGAFSTVDLLLWHTRHSLRTLNSALEEAAQNGFLPPEEYTFYWDAQCDKEKYYSILPRDEVSGIVSIDTLKDINIIDKRRLSVMACTLSEYYRKFCYQEREKEAARQFFFLPLFARFANALPSGAEF